MGKKHLLLKELCPKPIRENSFEAGVGGSGGTLGYQTGYGTPAGGNTTQNPDHFSSSDKTTNHMNNQVTGSSPVANLPDPNKPTKAEPSPAAKADQAKSDTPLNPDLSYDKDVNQMFQKKDTPNPDEIMAALQFELGKMVKKDKSIAKKMVLKNLKDNPHYYSQLDMLNMDDKKMKVDETQISKTKAVLDEMIALRQEKKTQLPPPPGLDEILKDMRYKRFGSK